MVGEDVTELIGKIYEKQALVTCIDKGVKFQSCPLIFGGLQFLEYTMGHLGVEVPCMKGREREAGESGGWESNILQQCGVGKSIMQLL